MAKIIDFCSAKKNLGRKTESGKKHRFYSGVTCQNKTINRLRRELVNYVGGKVLLQDGTEGCVTGVFPGENDHIVVIVKTSLGAEIKLNFLLKHVITRTTAIPNSDSRIKRNMVFPQIKCLTELPFNKKH